MECEIVGGRKARGKANLFEQQSIVAGHGA
jgi:hypothetical protein